MGCIRDCCRDPCLLSFSSLLLPFTPALSMARIAVEGSFAFSFVEGVLVRAIREGKWVLLDEINLASAETLQRLSGLLEVRVTVGGRGRTLSDWHK